MFISVTEADFAKNWLAHAHAHMTDGGALAEQLLVGKFYDAMKRKADKPQESDAKGPMEPEEHWLERLLQVFEIITGRRFVTRRAANLDGSSTNTGCMAIRHVAVRSQSLFAAWIRLSIAFACMRSVLPSERW